MTSPQSPLNLLGPVPERWLVGAVIELSSSEVGRAAAAAWMVTYERARAHGWDPDEAEACADDAYDGALNEDERAATLCVDNEEDYLCRCSWLRTATS